MTRKVSIWLSTFVLLEWGAIFVYFYGSGRISQFLHPYFQPWVLLAGLLMLVTSGVIFFSQVDHSGHDHGDGECCQHDQGEDGRVGFGKWFRMIVLLLPMAGAAVFSPEKFGEVFLQNRKTITTAAELPGSFQKESPLAVVKSPPPFPSKEVPSQTPVQKSRKSTQAKLISIMDLVYSAGSEKERLELEGKTIALIGQLSRDRIKGLLPGDFGLYEVVMVCCAADARPVSIRIEYQDLDPTFKNTDWIRVTGKVHFLPAGQSRIPLIQAEEVSESEPAEDPYLSL